MDMAIPDHVQRNLASIQADLVRNWQTISSGNPSGSQGFDGFLKAAVTRARDLANPMPETTPGFMPLNAGGMSGPSAGLQAFMAGLQQPYSAVSSPQLQQQGASVLDPAGGTEAVPLMPGFQSYKAQSLPIDGSTPIADAAYYDGRAMTPEQIDQFLRDKRSPFADQRFDGGKTAGQLIWEASQTAGGATGNGPRSINPAILVAIMGAETSYGRDGHWSKTNPFSIRLNGDFGNVKDFQSSLRIAAKTMYNWAQDRPANSHESLFDYAGRHYCENYEVEWKPNVEKFYRQALGFGASQA
jgi:hypothetical protein